ncbi:zinc finger protein 84-like isoform X2 [Ambystoma mexicanum]|uniref:zinc finger protein 84-like isoform X2 n=1 Tax=Ambystoma mexicanum TaxID=8296 RepID=UPI0037E72121
MSVVLLKKEPWTIGICLNQHDFKKDFSETEQQDQDFYLKLVPMTFEDVSFHFTEKEWEILQPFQKQLYQEVMHENYGVLVSLGYDIPKPELLSMLEEGKLPCFMPPERTCVFVPIDEDVTEAFLNSLIAADEYDSDPDAGEDCDSTDDSMPDVPEPMMSNGPVLPLKRVSEDSTVFVQEITMNGRQWNVTVNCIATKPVGHRGAQTPSDLGIPDKGFASQSGINALEALENLVRVNGRSSPALRRKTKTPEQTWQKSIFGSGELNSYNIKDKPDYDAHGLKVGTNQQKFKIFNTTEHVNNFHFGADIPLLLNIKQEDNLEKGLAIDVQPKQFFPLDVDIKEETEAIPISHESCQENTGLAFNPPYYGKRGNAQKTFEAEKSGHSDTESSRRHSTRIKEKQPDTTPGNPAIAGQSNQLEQSANVVAAPTGRKRKNGSEDTATIKEGPKKRGPKPRNQNENRPALQSRLPEQQVPLAVQKMYRCSKCQRTFSHYSQFVAHQRYEMKKKANESTKGPKNQKSTKTNKGKPTEGAAEVIYEVPIEASTSQRATRSVRKPDDSKNKENNISKSPLSGGQRLRERRTYTCSICKETFTNKSSVIVHKGTNNEEVYNCSKCEEAEGHAVPGGTKYECGICQKTFAHRTGLVAHLRIHTGDKPHQCSECQQTFSYKSALIVHQRAHKKEMVQPNVPEMVQPKVPEMVQPKVGENVQLKVPQKVQEKMQPNGQEKVQPNMQVTVPEPKRTYVPIAKAPTTGVVRMYQCPQCKEEFSNSTLLFTHQQTHTGPKPHQCQFCDKSFNDKALLTVHLKTHTGESPYQCGKCQKTFTSQSLLIAHGLTHSSGKPFQCKMCDKSFNGEALLLSHQRTHTGEKTYQCIQCKDNFSSETLLTEHQKVHMEDRPHKCDYCEKGFNSQALLVAHRRIHTGEKAFHCHYCGEGFNTSSLLNVHLRNHAPEKPYPCDLCERSFNLKSLQQAHRATHEVEK